MEYLKSQSIRLKEVREGKVVSYVCVIEALKYREISIMSKNYYPKSVCEITEHMLINKTVD